MGDVTIKLDISYSDIEEVRKTSNKNTVIIFKSGDKITLYGDQAKSVFKSLLRNFSGEHLD